MVLSGLYWTESTYNTEKYTTVFVYTVRTPDSCCWGTRVRYLLTESHRYLLHYGMQQLSLMSHGLIARNAGQPQDSKSVLIPWTYYSTRSPDCLSLVIPPTRTVLGVWSISAAGPRFWYLFVLQSRLCQFVLAFSKLLLRHRLPLCLIGLTFWIHLTW